MSERSGRQIRSFHRAFHFELMLYTLGNLRPWRPVPARGVFYTAVCEVMMALLAHAPVIGGVISGLGPVAVYGVIPIGLGWLLTVARVEGRRFHIAARVWARHLRCARTLSGGYRAVARPGSRWRPRRVLVINDGRDGAAPSGLLLGGPGRLLLRYPCRARLDGARLTVVQTTAVPRDPGQVLTIAEGASARFVGPADPAAPDVDRDTAPDRGLREVTGSIKPDAGVLRYEAPNGGRRGAGGGADAGASAGGEGAG